MKLTQEVLRLLNDKKELEAATKGPACPFTGLTCNDFATKGPAC